jgi:signal peptidase II
VAGVAVTVIALDQATKWLALRELDGGRTIDLVWTLRLRLVFNTGSAFGIGSRFAPIVALVAAGVVVLLLHAGRGFTGTVPRLAVGAIVGGAVGNLLDRVFRDGGGFLGGAVVDFVDLQWWPVFNVADVAISLGAIVLAISAGREKPERGSG